jgi:hypothetical protein
MIWFSFNSIASSFENSTRRWKKEEMENMPYQPHDEVKRENVKLKRKAFETKISSIFYYYSLGPLFKRETLY